MKLQRKIPLMLLPAVLVPMLLLAVFAYQQVRARAEHDMLLTMGTLLGTVKQQVDARLETALANAALLGASDMLRRYLFTEDEEQRYILMQPGLMALFATYQRAYPEYFEIRVVLPDGYEDTRSAIDGLRNYTEDESGSAWFQRAAAAPGDVSVQVVEHPDSGELSLLVSQRLRYVDESVDPIASSPRLRGYLVIGTSLQALAEQVAATRLGEGGAMRLLDSRSPDGDGDSAQALQPGEAARRVGDRFVQAVELIDGLQVVGQLPVSEFDAISRRLAAGMGAVALAATAVLGALLFAAVNSLLLRPLVQLREAVQQMSRGKLDVDIGLHRHDELGELAVSFEEMGRSLRRSDEQVRYMAYHDSLTGLPNRRMFLDYGQRALAHAQREGETLAVLFMDVDDFKRVNDSLGHEAGDALLTELSGRLVNALRASDLVVRERPGRGAHDTPAHTVARLGGDEFTLLLPQVDDLLAVVHVAQRVLDVVSEPFVLRGEEFVVGSSIGIAMHPGDGDDVETLLKHADLAMYHAKNTGKGGYQFFQPQMNAAALQRVSMETALRRALQQDELLLHYQPQVDSRDGSLVGMEALLRWRSPHGGMVSPAELIPVAEETGLIGAIGAWVLDEACGQLARWQEAGYRPVPVAVNVSARQLRRGDLDTVVKKAVTRHGLDAGLLQVELTETGVMQADEQTLATLDAIKAFGVSIAMDDFGTGYSSLSALRHLPIDVLKIDRSFVDELTADRDDEAVVTAIIALAASLNLEVVAEGVETEAQLGFLRGHGCRFVQGFLTGRPMPPADAARLLCAAPRPARATG